MQYLRGGSVAFEAAETYKKTKLQNTLYKNAKICDIKRFKTYPMPENFQLLSIKP